MSSQRKNMTSAIPLVKEECFVYQFPEDSRKTYESMQIPFAVYQDIGGKIVPLLVSDGLCLQLGIDREKLMKSAKAYGKSPYGAHLKAVAEGKVRY